MKTPNNVNKLSIYVCQLQIVSWFQRVDTGCLARYHSQMKRIIVALLFLLLFVQVNTVHAEDMMVIATDSAVATKSAPAKNDYTFVFPGILPDNPLYFLKAARDKFVSILISDHLKRAEFDLLASDKRLVAATILLNKNQDELGITTLSKSNNYMEQVLSNLSTSKKMGQTIDTVLHNTEMSIRKHGEELAKVKRHVNPKYMQAFNAELKRLSKLEKSASNLRPKPKS